MSQTMKVYRYCNPGPVFYSGISGLGKRPGSWDSGSRDCSLYSITKYLKPIQPHPYLICTLVVLLCSLSLYSGHKICLKSCDIILCMHACLRNLNSTIFNPQKPRKLSQNLICQCLTFERNANSSSLGWTSFKGTGNLIAKLTRNTELTTCMHHVSGHIYLSTAWFLSWNNICHELGHKIYARKYAELAEIRAGYMCRIKV
jgi:hypothetical protein